MFFSLVKRLHLDGSYIRSWLILAIDLAVSATATLVAFLGIDYFVRNSGFSLLHYLFLLVSAFFCSAVAFYIFRTYRTVIRHSSLREVWKLGAATLLKELLMLLILWFWPDGMTFKAIGLCVVLDLFVTVCMLITVRVLMILLYDAIILSHIRRTNRIRTLVYGVESKEVALVMRLQNSPHYDMCGFITSAAGSNITRSPNGRFIISRRRRISNTCSTSSESKPFFSATTPMRRPSQTA